MKKNLRSVLFICADQWRYDCFGFMKHKVSLTPNIDKLAGKSSVFKSHFAGIVPCGPSRTTMLTGGFNVREAQLITRSLKNLNFIGGDVVEVSPPFDVKNITSHVAATIAFEMLCTMTKTN